MFWYTGENGTTPAQDTATAQVGPNMTVSYGMRANEQAITTLVANVAVLAATTYSAGDPNAQTSYQALSQKVTANLDGQPGTQQISDIEANLANAQTAQRLLRHDPVNLDDPSGEVFKYGERQFCRAGAVIEVVDDEDTADGDTCFSVG